MFPTPDDLGQIPVWRNYLCCQLMLATLGNASSRIVFAGLKERGETVTLIFYVDAPLQDDYREIAEIMESFDDLTGNLLDVRVHVEEWDPSNIDPEAMWTYRRWIGEESMATESTGRLDELKVKRI